MLALAIVSVLLVASGSVMLFKPDAYYRIWEAWKSDSAPEPSDLYTLFTRIGGGICIALGLFAFIGSLLFLTGII